MILFDKFVQKTPDAVSCWLHCVCCKYVTDI